MLAGVARPSPERVYTGSEDGRHHAAVMAGDGALVRARERASDRGLYVQRVAAPGAGSDFSAWTRLDYASLECNVALCAHGATVLLFFVDNYDGRTIYLRESGDNGATWAASQTVVVPSGDGVHWLAAAFNASGTAVLFCAASDSRVYVKKRAGPRWSTSRTWTNDLSGVTGLACVYTRDWDLAVAGADPAGGPGLWTCIHGDGGEQASDTWSALRAIGRAQEDSDVEFHTPFLSSPDVTRLSYVEKYSGVTPSKRIHLLHTLPGTSFAQDLWRDPIPFDLETEHGLALASDSGTLWLSHPAGVWRGTLAGGPLDVSRDVLELSSREGADGGQVTMVLRNDDGRYGRPGAGALAAMRQGSEVRVSPGYVTPQGTEVSSGAAYWVSGWEHLSQGGRATLTLYAVDAWGILGGWHARRQLSWDSGESSVRDILAYILNRVGFTLNAPDASGTIETHRPEFTVHPGQSGSAVVRRLLALAPDVLSFRGHEGRLRQVRESDAADYAFGGEHALLAGHYSRRSLPYTRVQVFGAAGVAELFAWEEVPLQGERLLQEHDLNLDTMEKADDRCRELLRRLDRETVSGDVSVQPNCGQELYDVVEITDARAGLTDARRRVTGVRLDFRQSGEPRYVQRLTLGGV